VASYRFNKPILQIARAMLPMYVILLIGMLARSMTSPVTPSGKLR
jgi:hypothetical protein